VPDFATWRVESLSRFNSCWDMLVYKPLRGIWAASSGCAEPSMITSEFRTARCWMFSNRFAKQENLLSVRLLRQRRHPDVAVGLSEKGNDAVPSERGVFHGLARGCPPDDKGRSRGALCGGVDQLDV
jgi:hypothetical protein